jgi:hypothetical protein
MISNTIFTPSNKQTQKKMRASKINQLEKIVSRIVELGKDINNADFNGASEIKISKLQISEHNAILRAGDCAKTMTEEEFDATAFEDMLCMDYDTACDMG